MSENDILHYGLPDQPVTTFIMLDQLLTITSTEPYSSNGGIRIKEVLIQPWETPDARIILEIWTDDRNDEPPQKWELTCTGLAQTESIPLAVFGGSAIRIYDDHPLLWHDKIYFSITGGTPDIAALMGDLFIAHDQVCGGWVDFHWLYGGLPETLRTLRENQLAIPMGLKDACFGTLDRHGVTYQLNVTEPSHRAYRLLLFSCELNWPDTENFRQPYIMAEVFSARRIPD